MSSTKPSPITPKSPSSGKMPKIGSANDDLQQDLNINAAFDQCNNSTSGGGGQYYEHTFEDDRNILEWFDASPTKGRTAGRLQAKVIERDIRSTYLDSLYCKQPLQTDILVNSQITNLITANRAFLSIDTANSCMSFQSWLQKQNDLLAQLNLKLSEVSHLYADVMNLQRDMHLYADNTITYFDINKSKYAVSHGTRPLNLPDTFERLVTFKEEVVIKEEEAMMLSRKKEARSRLEKASSAVKQTIMAFNSVADDLIKKKAESEGKTPEEIDRTLQAQIEKEIKANLQFRAKFLLSVIQKRKDERNPSNKTQDPKAPLNLVSRGYNAASTHNVQSQEFLMGTESNLAGSQTLDDLYYNPNNNVSFVNNQGLKINLDVDPHNITKTRPDPCTEDSSTQYSREGVYRTFLEPPEVRLVRPSPGSGPGSSGHGLGSYSADSKQSSRVRNKANALASSGAIVKTINGSGDDLITKRLKAYSQISTEAGAIESSQYLDKDSILLADKDLQEHKKDAVNKTVDKMFGMSNEPPPAVDESSKLKNAFQKEKQLSKLGEDSLMHRGPNPNNNNKVNKAPSGENTPSRQDSKMARQLSRERAEKAKSSEREKEREVLKRRSDTYNEQNKFELPQGGSGELNLDLNPSQKLLNSLLDGQEDDIHPRMENKQLNLTASMMGIKNVE